MSASRNAAVTSFVTVLIIVTAGLLLNIFLGPEGGTNSEVTSRPGEFAYKRTALVTAAYFLFFYLAVFYQSMIGLQVWNELKSGSSGTKKDDDASKQEVSLWEVKYGPISYEDKRMVAGNRVVGNTLEQMPAFLMGLWLTAVTTTDGHASLCGWIYLIFRASYGYFYNTNPNLVLLATFPNYITVTYLWITIARACLDV